ncbi:hypothetical protein [Leucobacter musarum]|uniref:hypothetical protein n=1 Tax=Leucobacter musarum TaxID=1930747 RepID=UPI0012E2E669|nr:hypothetical protein [Leucobacter musarum]
MNDESKPVLVFIEYASDNWPVLLVSVLALLVSTAAFYVGWRSSAPKLIVSFDTSETPTGGSYPFKITNNGDHWISNIRISWAFDPTGFHAPKDEWSNELLMPGESFSAKLHHFGAQGDPDPDTSLGSALSFYEEHLLPSSDTKRRTGRASFRRQVLPYVRLSQRVALPKVVPGVSEGFEATIRGSDASNNTAP